jgi:2-keto-4-pentenoate hydratase/2-oxohepta-3-ene-1,7-dioic acid hydratase in catechol pathway
MRIARARRLGAGAGCDVIAAIEGALARVIELPSGPTDGGVLGVAALAGFDAGSWRLCPAEPVDGFRFLAPVPRPGKIIGIGVNYSPHAAEAGVSLPGYPEVFAKFTNAIADPDAQIALPAADAAVDYEGELAVVIGRRTRQVRREQALGSVLGYTIANDLTARTLQLRVTQWTTGKSVDAFCPLGPWIVTPDEIPDPQTLRLRTRIGGELRQDGSTSEMLFPVAQLIAYLSQTMTLDPGDVVLTGTPAGVGHAASPPRYLQPGDVVSVEIDGIGLLRNTMVRE